MRRMSKERASSLHKNSSEHVGNLTSLAMSRASDGFDHSSDSIVGIQPHFVPYTYVSCMRF